MKCILVVLSISIFAVSMDRPLRLEPKRREPDYVEKALSMLQPDIFLQALEKGKPVTLEDIEQLATLSPDQNLLYKQKIFWTNHGVNFLIKANLDLNTVSGPASLATLAAKKAGENKNISLALQRLPSHLRRAVVAGNPSLIQKEFENLFDTHSKLTNPTKLELAKAVWQVVLEQETIPYALRVLTELSQTFKRVNKQEPPTINTMVDQLVAKICKNLLIITQHLRSNNLLDPLIKTVAQEFDLQVANALNNDLAEMATEEKALLQNLLGATRLTCPVVVKGIVIQIIKKRRTEQMSSWQTIRHAFLP